jgi:ubiquinone/menaquinone biosynthesis C-methylase UbiE
MAETTTTQGSVNGGEAPDRAGRGGYALERTPREYERLRTQARFWEPATRRVLDAIGVTPGMRCLDVGCGPGEGLRLLAEHVGPEGSVTGIDNDPAVGQEAAAYVRATTATQVHVVTADFRDLAEPPTASCDLVTVRLVLTHVPDPVAALRHLYGWVRPGGALLVQDYDMRSLDMWPPIPHWHEVVRVVGGTIEALGGDPRCGVKLPLHFTAAGLGGPDGVDVSSVLAPAADTEAICETGYRSILPAALRLGLVTEERSQEVLAQLSATAEDRHRLVLFPHLVSCWTRKPA